MLFQGQATLLWTTGLLQNFGTPSSYCVVRFIKIFYNRVDANFFCLLFLSMQQQQLCKELLHHSGVEASLQMMQGSEIPFSSDRCQWHCLQEWGAVPGRGVFHMLVAVSWACAPPRKPAPDVSIAAGSKSSWTANHTTSRSFQWVVLSCIPHCICAERFLQVWMLFHTRLVRSPADLLLQEVKHFSPYIKLTSWGWVWSMIRCLGNISFYVRVRHLKFLLFRF